MPLFIELFRININGDGFTKLINFVNFFNSILCVFNSIFLIANSFFKYDLKEIIEFTLSKIISLLFDVILGSINFTLRFKLLRSKSNLALLKFKTIL